MRKLLNYSAGMLVACLAFAGLFSAVHADVYPQPGVARICDGVTNSQYCVFVSSANALKVDASGAGITNASSYPTGATPVTATSSDVAAASAVATLPGVAAKTTYLTGFTCTSSGATAAATVDLAVTGTISGSLTYIYTTVAGATLTNPTYRIDFSLPIPASAVNTAIVVTLPSLGTGNLHAACNATGYQL